MVVIRLARQGAKKSPFYHVVVIDSRKRREGRPLERVGYSNPVARGQAKALVLNMDRIKHWTGQGAQMSDTVARLVKGYHPEQTLAQTPAANDANPKTAKVATVKAETAKPETTKVDTAKAETTEPKAAEVEAVKTAAAKDDADKA
jgi:small subunit ribosomal protein S16